MADFPGAVWTPTPVTDLVTYWTKALIDEHRDETVALQDYILTTNRTANTFLAGPASGAASPFSIRALALADLPFTARGTIYRGGATAYEELAAETDGWVLIGDGTDLTSRALVGADVPAGTPTTRGTLELATPTEVQTGTDTERAVTAAGVRADIPATLAANRGVRLDGSANLVMPAGGDVHMPSGTFVGISGDVQTQYATGNAAVMGGKFSVGIAAGDGLMHVWSASAGTVVAHADADELALEGSGPTGMSINTADAQDGNIYWCTPSDALAARITNNFTNNLFEVGPENAGAELSLLYGAGAEGMRIDSSGNIGIGTDSPGDLLELAVSAASKGAVFAVYSTNVGHKGINYFRKSSNASIGTLAVTADGEDLGRINFQGVNSSSAWATAAAIFIEQDGTAGADYVPGRMMFYTGTNAGAASERMRIDNTGNVRIGGAAVPAAQLHVDQPNSSGAEPVLTLDQADIDVVLMKIIAAAAAASVDRTLVADSDFGTPGALVGWIQIEIQDDGNRVADGDYYLPFYAAPS